MFKNRGNIKSISVVGEYSNRIFIEFTEGKDLGIVAVGECCSYSYFSEVEGYPFTSLIGKKIIDIDESHSETPLTYYDRTDRELKITKIQLTLENNEDFFFELVNESNGYYSGWIEYDYY